LRGEVVWRIGALARGHAAGAQLGTRPFGGRVGVHPVEGADARKNDHAQPHHYHRRGLLATPTVRRREVKSVFGTRGDGDTVLFHAVTKSRTFEQAFDYASL
jgi:hypothetical protein